MKLNTRQAVEALRAGIPNGEAVRFLGTNQEHIMRRFAHGALKMAESARPQNGFLLGGEFGSGKSHVLECLTQDALERGFAVSRISISKETSLSQLDLVYKTAVKAMRLPDRKSADLGEVATKIDKKSVVYQEFIGSITNSDCALDPIFPASLDLYERLRVGDYFVDAIRTFWDGGRLSIPGLRKEMRRFNAEQFALKTPNYGQLATERFVFAAGLLRAAGYKGWVILLDEIELVARFPLNARAQSYVNLMWLLGYGTTPIANAFTVAAATNEFTGEILVDKRDQDVIPRSRMALRNPELAQLAVAALGKLDENAGAWERIIAQDRSELDRLYSRVRELYKNAFDWHLASSSRPADNGVPRSMRIHIREWITRWDLLRLDSSYVASISSRVLKPDLTEQIGIDESDDQPTDDRTDLLAG